jgi:hypothetical protein
MAALRNLDGTIARFLVSDGEGNEGVGHLELQIVANFEPGGRNGDLIFVMDEKRKSARTPQSPSELLQQARPPRLMS